MAANVPTLRFRWHRISPPEHRSDAFGTYETVVPWRLQQCFTDGRTQEEWCDVPYVEEPHPAKETA